VIRYIESQRFLAKGRQQRTGMLTTNGCVRGHRSGLGVGNRQGDPHDCGYRGREPSLQDRGGIGAIGEQGPMGRNTRTRASNDLPKWVVNLSFRSPDRRPSCPKEFRRNSAVLLSAIQGMRRRRRTRGRKWWSERREGAYFGVWQEGDGEEEGERARALCMEHEDH